ncbi:MAG: YhjD/YihY/BrkB family envelope integrity protein [Pirellulaceae bacterium]
MRRLTDYITDAVRRPREQLTRGQHNVRYAWELGAHCWRQLLHHRAEGMAAELTYRTIFSLIPVVVLGLVMFRVVGGLDEVHQTVENQLYSFFGVPEIPVGYLESFDDEDVMLGADPTADSPAELTSLASDADETLPASEGGEPEGGSTTSPDQTLALTPPDDSSADELSEADEKQTEIDDKQIQVDAEILAETDPPESIAEMDARAAAIQREEARRQTRDSIRRTLHEATTKVSSIDFASIGVFGLLLFVYAAVALADSTEYLFNRIYDAPRHRPVHIRLAIHWSIITLGSGLLAMSLYMSGQFVAWAGTVGAGSTIQMCLARLLSVGASWVLLFLLYALMPNTNVSPRAAVIGSLVGSLLWEGAKFGFQIYVSTAVPYHAIYGSLGLIPLFLFWIYVTWLIVLFGLILTYTLQTVRGRRLRRIDHDDNDLLQGDPDWMLPIMSEVAHAFQNGQPIDHQEIADSLGLSGRIVHEMTHRLIDAGLLRRVTSAAGEEDALTLARPAEQISVSDILELAHQWRPLSCHPAWKTLSDLKKAQRAAATDQTLAHISKA